MKAPLATNAGAAVSWPVCAFDNYFDCADREYPQTERWDLLGALGYDLAYVAVDLNSEASWAKLDAIPAEVARTGMELAAVYSVLDIDQPRSESGRSPLDIIDRLPAGGTLDLAIRASGREARSEPALDSQILRALEPLIVRARDRGITVSVYPHIWFLVERIEDAVRIADRAGDPAVRVTFSGFHWYAVDGTDLEAKLCGASHRIHLVNVCGAHQTEAGRDYPLPAVIEPVGMGDFPLEAMLKTLHAIGYRGAIAFQGYGIGGHPPATLAQSIRAYRAAMSDIQPSDAGPTATEHMPAWQDL